MNALQNVAVMAARRGGAILIGTSPSSTSSRSRRKATTISSVTPTALPKPRSSKSSRTTIPDHAILAEESGSQGESDTVWIIDPLDGTTNFLHGFPQFCVSVGVQVKGRMEAAAVYDPMRQEIFAAARGEGATLDGRKIRVSGRKEMDYALIGTGFPFRQKDSDMGPTSRCWARSSRTRPVCADRARLRSISATWRPGAWTVSGRRA